METGLGSIKNKLNIKSNVELIFSLKLMHNLENRLPSITW
jgi:hypothetical protein